MYIPQLFQEEAQNPPAVIASDQPHTPQRGQKPFPVPTSPQELGFSTVERLQQLKTEEDEFHAVETKEIKSRKSSRKIPLELDIQRLCREREFNIGPRDWDLVLEVCERATSNEANAIEAVEALRREFKYSILSC